MTPVKEELLRYRKNQLIDDLKRLEVDLEAAVYEAGELTDEGALEGRADPNRSHSARDALSRSVAELRDAREYMKSGSAS